MKPIAGMSLFAAVLAGCAPTPGADVILGMSRDTQIDAHLTCQARFGLNVPQAIQVLELDDGRVLVSTGNGPGVTLAQARGINQCAREVLLSQDGTQQGVTRSAALSDPTLQPVAQSRSPMCGPKDRGMVRGTLYC